MGMIPQDMSEKQESAANVLRDILSGIPAALSSGSECIYILVKDLSKELGEFISTGKTDKTRLHALSREDEQAVAECCALHDLTLNYCSQRMDYMHRKVTVTYPQISGSKGGVKVLLIPWFTLPDRPYPVFIYIYAIWHYNASEKKSQRLSAEAAGKLFGIDSFNKSTVCRNIKAMGGLPEAIRADGAAPGGNAGTKTIKEVIGCIPEILKSCPSNGSLDEMLGGNVAPNPKSVSNAQNLPYALSAIPHEYSQVILEAAPAGDRRRDTRKRPARPRKKPERGVQRTIRFVDSVKIECIRRGFITACRSVVIDSAAVYHKFVL
jgi:hypothetical protein